MPSILVAAVLLAVRGIAEAQQPKKIPRIGYLSTNTAAAMVDPLPRHSGWVYVSLATWREKYRH